MPTNSRQVAIVENGAITAHGWLSDLFPEVGSWPSGGIPSANWLTVHNAKLIRFDPTSAEYDPVSQVVDRSVAPYIMDDEVLRFSVVDKDLAEVAQQTLNQALADLAAKRWSIENGGVTVSGMPVRTDPVYQGKLAAVKQAADADPTLTVNWKLGNGSWTTLDATTITSLFTAVTVHVQACFANEKVLSDELVAAHDGAANPRDAMDAIAAVDTSAGWPVSI